VISLCDLGKAILLSPFVMLQLYQIWRGIANLSALKSFAVTGVYKIVEKSLAILSSMY